ncbi:MAG: hypothetical protein ACYC5M_07050 [Anaerolineae bacterium]
MLRSLRTFSLCVSLLVALGLLPGIANAQEPNRAGVVVVLAPDRVLGECVSFSEAQLSGAELLRRAGLRVVSSQSGGIGETICKIEAVGCDFPGQDCFCQCPGATCNYWSYWYWENGDWVYSGRGASNRQVVNGGLDAWVWGDGKAKPPAVAPCESMGQALQEPGYPPPAQVVPYDPYPAPDATPFVPDAYVPPEQAPTNTPLVSASPTPTSPPDATTSPTRESAPTEDGSAYPAPGQPTSTMRATQEGYPAPAVTGTKAATPSATEPSGTETPDKAASLIAEYAAGTAEPSGNSTGRSGYVAFGVFAVLLLGGVGYALYMRRQGPPGE